MEHSLNNNGNYDPIKAIAENPAHYMYAKARVLCNVAAGADSSHSMYGSEVLFQEPDSILQAVTMEVSVTCYPNPFSSGLSVEVTNLTGVSDSVKVELVDLNGNIQASDELFLDAFDMENTVFTSLGSLPSGYYVIRVLSNGTMIKSTLVQK